MGEAVRLERNRRDWTKEKAAKEAGIDSLTWAKIETGQPVQDRKLAKAEAAFEWEPGTLDKIRGGIDFVIQRDGLVLLMEAKSHVSPSPEDDVLVFHRPAGVSDADWEVMKAKGKAIVDAFFKAEDAE